MYCRLGTNITKCLLWSLKAETSTHSIWQDELHAAVEVGSQQVNVFVLDVDLCEMEKC